MTEAEKIAADKLIAGAAEAARTKAAADKVIADKAAADLASSARAVIAADAPQMVQTLKSARHFGQHVFEAADNARSLGGTMDDIRDAALEARRSRPQPTITPDIKLLVPGAVDSPAGGMRTLTEMNAYEIMSAVDAEKKRRKAA